MQTFLPFKSFIDSAKSLDSERLGKQRAEVKQMLIAIYLQELRNSPVFVDLIHANPLSIQGKYYERVRQHPCTKMWEDHPFGLAAYGVEICLEWRARGNNDSVLDDFEEFGRLNDNVYLDQAWLEINQPQMLPPWLGDERLHKSHRSNLIKKNPPWYIGVKGWNDTEDLPYFWPSKEQDYA